jgi:DNA (cytosine-5)-methyltransferase 1
LAVDLFAGAGGLSLGLEKAGWKVAVAVDHDPRVLETHRHNFGGLTLDLDLGDPGQRADLVGLLNQVEIDLVAGGPPCQPFSRAGRSKIRSLVEAGLRDSHDHRQELWRGFLDIALKVRPRAVLMENVPDMALGDDFFVVRTMVEALEGAGYATQVQLADAWKFGVPQHRKRLILLARNDGQPFTWPDSTRKVTTLKDAIDDLPRLGQTTGGRRLSYTPHAPLSAFAQNLRSGSAADVVFDHMTRPVRDDDRAIFAMMNSQTRYSQIPARLRRYAVESFDDKYKRLAWDELSRSITAHIAKDGYWYIHPEEGRTLTVREAARIQTFPDAFRFAGTRSDAFRQIGNAVPPLLGEAAAAAVRRVSRSQGDVQDQPGWSGARAALAAWAKEQRHGPHWHMLPGIGTTPAVAVVAALLNSSRTDLQKASRALSVLRGRARLTEADLQAVRDELASPKARNNLERLRGLGRKQKVWAQPILMPDVVSLKPGEADLYLLLIGEDLLLSSQGVHRVAARVAGTNSHIVNRGSDGRVDLARLVGAGEEATLRMAAIRLLSAITCTHHEPACEQCPLADWCITRSSRSTAADVG